MNQFQFYIAKTITFTTAAGNYSNWTSGTNRGWVVKSAADQFDFKIQGFNNINLYGIQMITDVQSGVSGVNHGIVEDYKFRINFTAQTPLISGVFNVNTFGAQTSVNEVSLGKYQSQILFAEPIKSCSNIELSVFSAQGYDNESLTEIKIDVLAQFYFFYKYEGLDLLV